MIKKYLIKSLAALTILTAVGTTSHTYVENANAGQKYRDDRVQVTDVTKAPYSGIVLLKADGHGKTGTGFIVGKNTILTNKHVALDFKDNPNKLKAFLKPIYTEEPLGGLYPVTKIIPYPGDEDLAVLHVTEHALGLPNLTLNKNTHTFQFNERFDSKIGDATITAGFPGSKPNGTMWEARGKLTELNGSDFGAFSYASAGQSGSPVFRSDNKVIGIVATASGDPAEKYTGGVFFTKKIVDFVKQNIAR